MLGILTKYANEVYWDKMSDQTLGILPSMNTGNVMQDSYCTKCLIRQQEYLPGFPSMLCKITTMSQHFPVCVIRHWEYLPNTNAGIVGKILSFMAFKNNTPRLFIVFYLLGTKTAAIPQGIEVKNRGPPTVAALWVWVLPDPQCGDG